MDGMAEDWIFFVPDMMDWSNDDDVESRDDPHERCGSLVAESAPERQHPFWKRVRTPQERLFSGKMARKLTMNSRLPKRLPVGRRQHKQNNPTKEYVQSFVTQQEEWGKANEAARAVKTKHLFKTKMFNSFAGARKRLSFLPRHKSTLPTLPEESTDMRDPIEGIGDVEEASSVVRTSFWDDLSSTFNFSALSLNPEVQSDSPASTDK